MVRHQPEIFCWSLIIRMSRLGLVVVEEATEVVDEPKHPCRGRGCWTRHSRIEKRRTRQPTVYRQRTPRRAKGEPRAIPLAAANAAADQLPARLLLASLRRVRGA